ncbi:hypothetical protein AB0N31_36545, partial [Streptomyces sp. NPDC051051]
RPDGYVAWTSPGSDHDLTDTLTRWFGHPHPTPAIAGPAAGGTHRTGA